MWLYTYEVARQNLIPGIGGIVSQDPYFNLLIKKKVKFFEINRGYDSVTATLKRLREENDRKRRFEDALSDFEDLDTSFLDDIDDEITNLQDAPSVDDLY